MIHPGLQFLVFLLSAVCARALDPPKPPNVVLIIADDQGWGDYGFMGHPDIQTPHLDRLAERSLVFERGHVTSPLCRPSLASIATGLHPHQHGVVANDVDPERRAESDAPVVSAFQRHPSLIRKLTAAGYITHQSGKWWEGSFTDGGFTHGMTHGVPDRGGRHGDEGLCIGREGMEPVTRFVDSAVEQQRPFFVWYAPFLPHTPHDPPEDILRKYRTPDRAENVARYYAMCEWFDRTCGELLEHLEQNELLDDTLVVFVCDNGWAPIDRETKNPPDWWPAFAPRSKGSPYEGGIRTPILFSLPGRVEPARSKELASSIDLMPTILRACGVEPPEDLPGIDLLDPGARQRREAIFGASYSIHNMVPGDPTSTLQYRWCLSRDWKLLLRSDGIDTTPYRTVHEWDQVPARLYDLRRDPHERESVLLQHPEVAEALRERIESWLPESDLEPESRDTGAGAVLELPGLEVDFERGVVDVEAVVCLDAGQLELIACTKGTKEHESIVAIDSRPLHLHTALLLLAARPGHPASMQRASPDSPLIEIPPQGGPVDVLLVLEGADGSEVEHPISEFIAPSESTDDPFPTHTFLFTGSLLQEVEEGPRLYLSDRSGNVVSLVSFGDEVLSLPGGLAHDADTLHWSVDSTRLPPVGSKVRLRLRPQVLPGGKQAEESNGPPSKSGRDE
jgi:arylsulfatase A-like enzyme